MQASLSGHLHFTVDTRDELLITTMSTYRKRNDGTDDGNLGTFSAVRPIQMYLLG